ncbi:19652_t:CDS:2 [Funneliformis geosporum]|nr:19652_t:CDS:2 [Funneliformis geosporum]
MDTEEPLHKPTPDVSTHTKPNSIWIFPIIRTKDRSNRIITFESTSRPIDANENFSLESGWHSKVTINMINEALENVYQ